jgi:hypothetical protein
MRMGAGRAASVAVWLIFIRLYFPVGTRHQELQKVRPRARPARPLLHCARPSLPPGAVSCCGSHYAICLVILLPSSTNASLQQEQRKIVPGALFEAWFLFRPGTFRIAFAPKKTPLFSS